MTKRYLMDNGLLAVPLTKNWDFDEDMLKLNEIFNLKQKLGSIYYSKECQKRVWKERERVDQDETLISFDVSPLNTNVPVKEAIKKAIDESYSENV